MSKFRKKPVVIDAWHLETCEQARGAAGVCTGGSSCSGRGPDDSWPHVHSLEGEHTWTEGDWLIRGVKGEFYFCKPDVFAATYEPAEPSSPVTPAEQWYCVECGLSTRFDSASAMHFDAYGHTPHMVAPARPEESASASDSLADTEGTSNG